MYRNVIVIYSDYHRFTWEAKGVSYTDVLNADLVIVARTWHYEKTGLKTKVFLVEKDRYGMRKTVTKEEIQAIANRSEFFREVF